MIFSPLGIPPKGIVLVFPLLAPVVDTTTTGKPVSMVARDFLPWDMFNTAVSMWCKYFERNPEEITSIMASLWMILCHRGIFG